MGGARRPRGGCRRVHGPPWRQRRRVPRREARRERARRSCRPRTRIDDSHVRTPCCRRPRGGAAGAARRPLAQPRSLRLRHTQERVMRRVFADSLYWVAMVNPNDPYRRAALAETALLTGAQFVTTEEV